MDHQSLIINNRSELPKRKRIIWDIVTLLLWAGFIYLWKPLFHIFYKILILDAPGDEFANWIFEEIHSVTFINAMYLLIGTPLILFILARLSRHHAPTEHLIFHFDDYAEYFKVEKESLQKCVNSQLVTVYFDDHGHIIKLEDQIVEKKK
jgi:biofilm PGA synthesis protein PgaD